MLTFTSFKLISTLGFMMGVGILSAYLFSLILIDGGQDEVV
jgi:predicted RND superfamily exporter protein